MNGLSRSIGSIVLGSLVATNMVSVVALGAGGHSSAEGTAACAEPYPPVYDQDAYPAQEPTPDIDATEVPTASFFEQILEFDLDGDGVDDETADGTGASRPAGDIIFERPGERIQVLDGGELDGRPGHEIFVLQFLNDTSFAVERSWVVPYGAPAGTHDPAAVGVEVSAGAPTRLPDAVGALLISSGGDDRGGNYGGETRRYDAADLFAVGVPGDATAVTPTATYTGGAQALVDFGGTEPTVVTATAEVDAALFRTSIDLVVNAPDGSTTSLTTRPSTLLGGSDNERDYRALDGPDGRFMVLHTSSRSGAQSLFWSLDDPCEPLTASATEVPRPSPAAEPVDANPSYTG